MKKMLLFSVVGAVLCLHACKKSNMVTVEAMEFGFSNFAWGADCQNYRWEAGHVYKSTQHCDPRDSILTYDLELSGEKEAIARNLAEQIRDNFYQTEPKLYDTACADCGMYFLKIERGEEIRTWYFTPIPSPNWPKQVRKTFKLVENAVSEMRQ